MLKAHAQAFLTEQEEADLFALMRGGDDAARDALIMAHIRIAYSAAIDLKGYGFSVEDLFQQGVLGLHQAIEKFDNTHGVRFGRYAKSWVRGAMTRYIVENWSLLKVETRLYRRMFFALRREQQTLQGFGVDFSALEPKFSDPELRAELEGVAPIILKGDRSLDAPIDTQEQDQGATLVDITPDESAEDVLDVLNAKQLRELLLIAVAKLPEEQRAIITQRFLGEEEGSRKTVAAAVGVSVDRARRSERSAIDELRRILSEQIGSTDFDALR